VLISRNGLGYLTQDFNLNYRIRCQILLQAYLRLLYFSLFC